MQHDVDKIVAEIDERSYCIIPSVISAEEADEARVILEGLLKAEATDASRAAKTQRVGGIAVKHPIFVELMAHPLILAIWKKYLDEECHLLDLDSQYKFSWFWHVQMASGFPFPMVELPLAREPGQRADDLAAQ